LMRARLDTVFDDLSHLWSDPEGEWDRIDITPGLQRAWRLATLGLPAEVTAQQELAALPPVWGSEAKLSLAVLYLLTFAVDLLPPAGELGIKAEPSPVGGVRLTVWFSGNPRSPSECQGWLNPFADPGRIRGNLGPALAAAIASQHRGSLTVAPREPGGAVFSLELPPLAEEPHEPVI
jgi:signal transduction histidine kinase